MLDKKSLGARFQRYVSSCTLIAQREVAADDGLQKEREIEYKGERDLIGSLIWPRGYDLHLHSGIPLSFRTSPMMNT